MSRDVILAAARANKPDERPYPDIGSIGLTYDDPVAQFIKAVGCAGSQAITIEHEQEITEHLNSLHGEAKVILSCIDAVESVGVEPDASSDPHLYNNLDLVICRGSLAVAENSAIWIASGSVPHPACLFLTQHLAIVVSATDIVHNMHEAYRRLATDKMPAYGTYIAGPSKTADIGQTLVKGAHGPRSLTVFILINESD